jgi:hypothetical protein
MNRPAFKDFRIQVAAYAQSVGSPLGICVNNIPALAGLANIATERLISDPMAPEEGWWGGWAKYAFNASRINPYLTMPRGVARIILQDVCGRPTKLQNEFYEFLDYGEGLQPKTCRADACGGLLQAYDRASTPLLGTLASTPQIIRVFPTDPNDVGKNVIIQGQDQNGNIVTGTDPITAQTFSGENLVLAQPFIESLNQFGTITGIEKDSTAGPITIQQVDPATGIASSLSSMEPSETAANYRRYLINKLPCNCCDLGNGIVQVTAMCKLEYVPIAIDSDYLGIPCVPALLAECEALRYETMDDQKALGLAGAKHQKALQLLFGQLNHYLGNERPAISVSLFGSRRQMRYQPV